MARRSLITAPRLFTALVAVAIAAAAGGCTSSVAGGGGAGGADGAGGATSDSCTTSGAQRSCEMTYDAPGQPTGVQECQVDAEGHLAWNACITSTTSSTPLVLSFDGGPVTLAASPAGFDIDGSMSVMTDWPAAATPWLALDRNANGGIDDGGELFGSATVLNRGERAANGFVALAELDSNGDGRITPEDVAWESLRLWSDADGDRVSGGRELTSLSARRILWIDLAYTSAPRCDARRNCEVERAAFGWADAAGAEHTGAIIDVHLRHQ